MSTAPEIKTAIEQLSPGELFKRKNWISSKFSEAGDKEIGEDIRGARLNQLPQAALAEFRAEKTTPFLPNEEFRRQ